MQSQSQFGASRREFLGAAAAALFAGVTITILGCDDDKSTGPKTESGDIEGTIEDNHGHSAILKKAVIDAGSAITLDIQGSASHTHTVSLSADDFAEIKKGNMVHKESSTTSSHSHLVMFN